MRMRLVVNAPYSSTTMRGEARLVATSGSSVAAKRIVVDAATFSLTNGRHIGAGVEEAQTKGVVMSGSVSSISGYLAPRQTCTLLVPSLSQPSKEGHWDGQDQSDVPALHEGARQQRVFQQTMRSTSLTVRRSTSTPP